jgi:tetratricopeptide (TPR) repeat protein
MKLIKGRTLRELLKERSTPADDRAHLVSIFEQIAQTIAYAHSKRVLHRDLKPANVMVGAFGEVQVMDWGLAKVLKPDARPVAGTTPGGVSVVRTVRAELADGETQTGSLLGTPEYMAPEQARGEVDDIDERSDVFGLGAILCEVLTGQPPYVGRSSDEARRKAARADLADTLARLENCEADAELIGLARACLAPEPLDRPRDAAQVAEAISTYRADVAARLRRAELAAVEEKARAEHERQARVLTEARVVQERRARRLKVLLVLTLPVPVGFILSLLIFWVAFTLFHVKYGDALRTQGDVASAIVEYRKAIRLFPYAAGSHSRLGDALRDQGDLAGAIAAYRVGIRLKPDYAEAHNNLAIALRDRGDVASAIAECREAIRFKPDYAYAHFGLGSLLCKQGKYAESLAEYRRAHELGSKQRGWSYPSAERVRQVERFVSLAPRLPAVLKGEDRPADSAERLAFGRIAYHSKRYAASAHLYAEAFQADPKLADDLKAAHRYDAACSAALAGAGKGDDDPPSDEAGRVKLGQQARDWLRANLALRRQQLDTSTDLARQEVRAVLQHWKIDLDLAGVRDPDALNKLPEEERQAWRDLWGEVDALLAQARGYGERLVSLSPRLPALLEGEDLLFGLVLGLSVYLIYGAVKRLGWIYVNGSPGSSARILM